MYILLYTHIIKLYNKIYFFRSSYNSKLIKKISTFLMFKLKKMYLLISKYLYLNNNLQYNY